MKAGVGGLRADTALSKKLCFSLFVLDLMMVKGQTFCILDA